MSYRYPQDHIEAKVIDSDGKVTPAGTPGIQIASCATTSNSNSPIFAPGELCTRGYSTMLGYWDDEAKTKEAITEDRWFHTG